ncbi:unnamed protein product [Gordionus sp. m RMFG-2023]
MTTVMNLLNIKNVYDTIDIKILHKYKGITFDKNIALDATSTIYRRNNSPSLGDIFPTPRRYPSNYAFALYITLRLDINSIQINLSSKSIISL